MSSIIDPDGYAPSTYRRVSNQVVETIDDAIAADGLNATERAQLVALRRVAMRVLNFREPVPDTIPLDWAIAPAAPAPPQDDQRAEAERQARKEAERQKSLAEKRAWRRAGVDQRDELVLAILPDHGLTLWEISVEMYRAREQHGTYCTSASMRKHLKSMEERGVLVARVERREVSRGRPATCWYPADARVSGQPAKDPA